MKALLLSLTLLSTVGALAAPCTETPASQELGPFELVATQPLLEDGGRSLYWVFTNPKLGKVAIRVGREQDKAPYRRVRQVALQPPKKRSADWLRVTQSFDAPLGARFFVQTEDVFERCPKARFRTRMRGSAPIVLTPECGEDKRHPSCDWKPPPPPIDSCRKMNSLSDCDRRCAGGPGRVRAR
jgi:hypothetical protein